MKAARFAVGTSGSPKHTEVKGDGSNLGGAEARPSVEGPRIGPGALGKRVKPDYDRNGSGKDGRPAVRNMSRYSEE